MAQRGFDMMQMVSPALPNFRARIQPPAPDGSEKEVELKGAMAPLESPVVHYDAAARAKELGQQRLVFSWHRSGDVLVGVEQAPDWELVGVLTRVTEDQLSAVLPVFRQLGVRWKDLTGSYANMTTEMESPVLPMEQTNAPLGRDHEAQARDAGVSAAPARGAASRRARSAQQGDGAAGGAGSLGLGATWAANGSGSREDPPAGVESVKQDD